MGVRFHRNMQEQPITVSGYYIDDVSVSEEDFENLSSDVFFIEIHKSSGDLKSSSIDGEELVEKRAYTSKDKYIAFGEENGLSFDKQLVFEEIMSDFAEKSGAISEYEEIGELPQWYLEREQFVYDSIFNSSSNLKSAQISLFITLFKNYYGGGGSVIMPTHLPVMYPGWNNKVSCVEFVGIGGSLVIYDKSFFRKRVSTIVNWGMTRINLPSGVNDRMSSGLKLF